MMFKPFLLVASLLASNAVQAQAPNLLRQNGIRIGVMPTGRLNAITDVQGVKVGQITIVQGDSVRTGVTSIVPHGGNLFQQKVPAAVFVGNGFGKLAGSTQIAELGNIESPIVLTNTLSVPAGIQGIIDYTLQQPGNEKVQSVNAVVGETNDGYLNDIRGMHVSRAQVVLSILQADTGVLSQGNVGAGTGTVCFGWKGGIGTASRQLPANLGGYTVGVLVQTNFGGVLEIAGVPVGQLLQKYALKDELNHTPDGSCMIVVATDAPLDARNLERLAKRAFMGLAKTGGIASNGSGDYVIAFSTANKVPHQPTAAMLVPAQYLHNEATTPLFMAAIEATEEAIINSLFAAETMKGKAGRTIEALPKEIVISLIQQYQRGNSQ
ncbi:DmpA family aminopeptidase [Phnomibacter sp.]|uniref:DmpA family aminopeptidase n=1 Tax=Phnomibacter sp. TaxID=2836217 RepID=UPI002FDCCDA3